jgi:hypothetical protein
MPRDIATNRKWLRLDDDGATIIAEGSWRRVSKQRSVHVPDVNSVRIECRRGSGICDEYIAKLITPDDSPDVKIETTALFMMKEQYQIVEWSGHTVLARADPRATDVELRVSLGDHVVERRSRETGARGAEGADPTRVEHWILK